MEPSDIPGGNPLEQPAPPGLGVDAGPEALRNIVTRAGRRRRRAVAGGVAAAVVLGAGAGYLVSTRQSTSQTVVAAGAGAKSNSSSQLPPGAPSSAGASVAGGSAITSPASMKKAFSRTTGAVTIRGFTSTFEVQPAAASLCLPYAAGPRFTAEVSTPAMVGTAVSLGAPALPTPSGQVVREATAQRLGEAEGDPVAVVIVDLDSGVAKVSMNFSGGTSDLMATVDGWAVLASEVSSQPAGKVAPVGTLEALSASGKVLQTMTVDLGYNGPQAGGVSAGGTGSGCSCPMIPEGGAAAAPQGAPAGAATGVAAPSFACVCGSTTAAGATSSMPCQVTHPPMTFPTIPGRPGVSGGSSGSPGSSGASTGTASSGGPSGFGSASGTPGAGSAAPAATTAPVVP